MCAIIKFIQLLLVKENLPRGHLMGRVAHSRCLISVSGLFIPSPN